METKHEALTRTVPVVANSFWYFVLALHVIYNTAGAFTDV